MNWRFGNKMNTTFFKNLGYITHKFTERELDPIWDEVEEVSEKAFTKSPDGSFHNRLAGHIKSEYELTKSKNYSEQLILPLIDHYNKEFDYFKNFSMLTKHSMLCLDTYWVNFQKKIEYNPIHTHSGLMSFVIWLQIPYYMSAEDSYEEVNNSKYEEKRNGKFAFLYTNALGEIQTHNIPVDKTYNGTIAIFPAKMSHMVYPFFSSDEYRVTVSGNFKIRV